jgi:hypothetical protein
MRPSISLSRLADYLRSDAIQIKLGNSKYQFLLFSGGSRPKMGCYRRVLTSPWWLIGYLTLLWLLLIVPLLCRIKSSKR